jgi:hypothetical protein
MAGDWIPMRTNLAKDPAVIAIAAATGLTEAAVVGSLHQVWSWANEHLEDGRARGVTAEWLDRLVGTTGFAAAMLAAGWLEAGGDGITVPKFERWNSQGAKRRVLATQRKRSERSPKCHAGSVTKTRPEKRREEKRREEEKTPPPTPAPETGAGGECATDYRSVPADGTETDPGKPAPDRPPAARGGTGDPAAAAVAAAGGLDDVPPPPPLEELLAAWNAAGLLAAGGSAARRGAWQRLWRDSEAFRSDWRAAVERAGRSPRCRGEAGDWKATIDWFLHPERDAVRRLVEGEFDAAAPKARQPPARETAAERFARLEAERKARAGGGG